MGMESDIYSPCIQRELNILKDLDTARKGQFERLKESLHSELITRIFDKYPEIEGFSWTQGTPSWCNGEPCHFYAYFDDYTSIPVKLKSNEDYLCVYDRLELENDNEIVLKIREVLFLIEMNLYKQMFGDGAEIVCTRDGFTISEWFED